MNTKGRPPVDALRTAMERGDTGCLTIHMPGRGSAQLILMEGEIRAAQTPRDGAAILSCLQARGFLDQNAETALGSVLAEDGWMSRLAGRVPEAVTQGVIYDCFCQVLLDSLFASADARFEAQSSVRPVHIQVGHDSRALVDSLARVHESTRSWRENPDGQVVCQTGTAPEDEAHLRLWSACADAPLLADILTTSAWFEGRVLVQLLDLVSAGLVIVEPAPPISAFADHDVRDRGLGRGTFQSDMRDRVELMRELGAPSLRTDGPRLDDAELARKVSVANEVLRSMVRALDRSPADAMGQGLMQLVLQSAPVHLRPLFEGVQVEADGRLDEAAITHNLRSRLPSEQRHLLQQGLCDLLDRALRRCMESLPETRSDDLLERVVGYQRRLGR